MNSVMVIIGAFVSLFIDNPRIIDKGLAVILACAMMWSCVKNITSMNDHHDHHH